MKENGAVGAEPATVGPALDKLAQTDPRAIMDLVDGINPNDDPTALSNDPVPEYGCAMTARNGPPGWPPAALVLGGLGIPVLRRVRRSGARLSRGV
jgi:MYXO-CTERM domain-containing protein